MNDTGPRYGIYAFYRNHAPQLLNFLNSIKNADEIMLCDVGSTDGSQKVIERFISENPWVNIRTVRAFISPWRYDDIRNIGLSLISRSVDLCLCLDIEETLVPDWKAILDDYYDPGISRYQYYIQEEKKGSIDIRTENRIHRNGGIFWKYPVYEELIIKDAESIKKIPHMLLKRTHKESEHDILQLLERYMKEEPTRWVPYFHLAEILLKRGNLAEAHNTAEYALKLDNCDKGKLNALKARIYLAEGLPEKALHHLSIAIQHLSDSSEWQLYIERARILSGLERHTEAFVDLQKAKQVWLRHPDDPRFWRNKDRFDAFMASEKKLALEEISS